MSSTSDAFEESFDSVKEAIKLLAAHCPSPTDVQPLLRNYVPSSRSSQKTATLHTIKALDDQISSLAEIVCQVDKLRKQFMSRRDDFQTSLSSIHAMPREVLRVIFAYIHDGTMATEVHKQILHITAVSKTWAEIARSQPGLWTHVYLPLFARNCQEDTTSIDTWLARSGNQGLSVWHSPVPNDLHKVSSEHLPSLQGLFGRIQRLYIETSSYPVAAELPVLQVLSLRGSRILPPPEQPVPTAQIHTLDVVPAINIRMSISELPGWFSQTLRSLNLERVNILAKLVPAILALSSIESIRLCEVGFQDWYEKDEAWIVPTLTSLAIIACKKPLVRMMLVQARYPRLESLALELAPYNKRTGNSCSLEWNAFFSFIRTASNLRLLAIYGWHCEWIEFACECLIDTLTIMDGSAPSPLQSTLEHLEIYGCDRLTARSPPPPQPTYIEQRMIDSIRSLLGAISKAREESGTKRLVELRLPKHLVGGEEEKKWYKDHVERFVVEEDWPARHRALWLPWRDAEDYNEYGWKEEPEEKAQVTVSEVEV